MNTLYKKYLEYKTKYYNLSDSGTLIKNDE